MENFSQNEEQRVILEWYNRGGIPRAGHLKFLDIGANDGITFSNTWALTKYYPSDWRGCLVEASPKAFEKLKNNYRGISGMTCYHFAMSDRDGTVILHESSNLISENDVALVSTIKEDEKLRFINSVEYSEIEVPCFKWETFLAASPLKQFELISMDIEGAELEVLTQMDLDKLNTRIIILEWNGREDVRIAYDHICKRVGLYPIYTSGENIIYAR